MTSRVHLSDSCIISFFQLFFNIQMSAYQQTFSTEEKKTIDNELCCLAATRFAISGMENQETLPTLYRLSNLNEWPYKSTNSNLLTSYLTSIKTILLNTVRQVINISRVLTKLV